jgi:phosphoglycerate dehydrogenase-like enzyme
MEKLTLLTPDAQYADDGEVERQLGGADTAWKIFRGRRLEDIPADDLATADGLVTWHVMKIDADFIARMPKCRVIVRAGVGYEHIDLDAAGRAGIPVCNTPDYGVSEVADHAIGLMLALRRGITVFNARLHADPHGGFALPAPPLVKRNRGGTFGLVGAGSIGLATGLRARAFGMRVLVYDPFAPAGLEIAAGFERTDNLDDILSEADVISLHCPLTDATRGMIDARAFGLMKPGAILVNTARGPIVDADALVAALRDGRLGGAGLDVFDAEPIPPESPLSRFVRAEPDADLRSRLILTPHAGWLSPESAHDVRRLSAANALASLRGGRPRNVVNRTALAAAGR